MLESLVTCSLLSAEAKKSGLTLSHSGARTSLRARHLESVKRALFVGGPKPPFLFHLGRSHQRVLRLVPSGTIQAPCNRQTEALSVADKRQLSVTRLQRRSSSPGHRVRCAHAFAFSFTSISGMGIADPMAPPLSNTHAPASPNTCPPPPPDTGAAQKEKAPRQNGFPPPFVPNPLPLRQDAFSATDSSGDFHFRRNAAGHRDTTQAPRPRPSVGNRTASKRAATQTPRPNTPPVPPH